MSQFLIGKRMNLTAAQGVSFVGGSSKLIADKVDLVVTADSAAWLKFLSNRTYLVWALITGKIKLKGSPQLLLMFGKCFVA